VLRIVFTTNRHDREESIMEPFDVFSARELRHRSGELFRDAEKGRLAVITRHGRPAILAIPFDDRLLALGVQRAVAVSLFETGSLSLAQGAKLAGLSLEEFVELLGREEVVAVDYPPEELAEELEAAG
jgi:antitoxin (DNA-binding transcriptional repressor) of toxin-antitoxin stability system